MATLMSFRFGHSDSYTDTIIANVDERSTGACSAPSARGLPLRRSVENGRCTSYWNFSELFSLTVLKKHFVEWEKSSTFVR